MNRAIRQAFAFGRDHCSSYKRNSSICTRTSTRLRSAFTLPELIMVLLLMSIMAAVAIPRWSDALQRFRVSNAAGRIVADLALARSAAYSSSTSRTVTFSIGSNQYTMNGVKPLKASSGSYVVALGEEPYRSRLVSVWGGTGEKFITFDGYGRPNTGGVIIIAAGDVQKSILVDSNSGTAVVQ